MGGAELPFFTYMPLCLSVIDDLSRDVPSIHQCAAFPMSVVPSERPRRRIVHNYMSLLLQRLLLALLMVLDFEG